MQNHQVILNTSIYFLHFITFAPQIQFPLRKNDGTDGSGLELRGETGARSVSESAMTERFFISKILFCPSEWEVVWSWHSLTPRAPVPDSLTPNH